MKRIFSLGMIFFLGLSLVVSVGFRERLCWADKTYEETEAQGWIEKLPPDALLVKNNFPTRQDASRLINDLYVSGAVYVGLVALYGEISGLRVYLPENNQEIRRRIFIIINKQAVEYGCPQVDASDQDSEVIWFNCSSQAQ
jgi:hypothetical protein